MLFDWRGRPALMFPTLAYCVDRPGAEWTRCSDSLILAEAQPLSDDEFWDRFTGWSLKQFPVQFALLERPRTVAPVEGNHAAGDSVGDERQALDPLPGPSGRRG